MYSGVVPIQFDIDAAELADHLADCLRRVKARNVVVKGNCIEFTGGMFRFVSNWNVLGPFGSGQLEIDPSMRQVRFRLSLAQLLIVVSLGMVLMGMFMISEPPTPPPALVAVFLPAGWCWLVGGNLLIGVPRFIWFLRRSISTSQQRLSTGCN